MELADRRQLQITEAALRVMSRTGVDGLRLVDVAEEAGVSLGMIQHYFRSRDKLVAESFALMLARSKAAWGRALAADEDVVGRLFQLLRFCIDAEGRTPFRDVYPLWIEFTSAALRDPELREQSIGHWATWSEPFEQTIAAGVAAGTFPADVVPGDVATRLIALVDGLSMRVLLGHFGSEEMYRQLVDAAVAALCIDRAEGARRAAAVTSGERAPHRDGAPGSQP